RQHCMTTRRTLVRGDGSTAHEGIFDVETGEFLRQSTQQGNRGDSCWSRGLAWSLYGFSTCYDLTGEPVFLEVSQANADYWVSNVGDDGLAPWDFDAPNAGAGSKGLIDSSASAIGAAGLIYLARHTTDGARRLAYRECALKAIGTLATDRYLGTGDDGWEGVLRGGVYHIHKNLGGNESGMWGEDFFVEALQLARGLLRSCR